MSGRPEDSLTTAEALGPRHIGFISLNRLWRTSHPLLTVTSGLTIFQALFPAMAPAASGESFSSIIREPDKLLSFLTTTLGRSLLVLLFFLAIVLLLRWLLGPGGKLRDPQWDKLNRQERERERLQRNLKAFRARLDELGPELERETLTFKEYVSGFLSGDSERDAMYLLKQEHSLNVLGHALSIAAQEEIFLPDGWHAHPSDKQAPPSAKASADLKEPGSRQQAPEITPDSIPEPDRILLLAALYHDLGRFEQLKRFNTFRDADSINHAELGAQLLDELATDGHSRFMAAEPEANRRMVRQAVLAHNLFALPEDLPPQMAAICHAVRDADKLDILRVMATEIAPGRTPDPTVVLGLADKPEKYTRTVLEAAQGKAQVRYAQMRYVNDFRLLLCSWLDNIFYPAAKSILAKNGHLQSIMNGLPDRPELRVLTERIKAELHEYK